MYDQPNRLVLDRLDKIRRLRDMGINPFPVEAWERSHLLPDIVSGGETLAAARTPVRVAGRLVGRRDLARIVFLDLLADGAQVQIMVRRADQPLLELLDTGDFLGVEGDVVLTRTEDLAIEARELTVLGKSTHPLPIGRGRADARFERARDPELLRRQRHLDVLGDTRRRECYIKRSRIVSGVRAYLDAAGFLEVETPILGSAYGGAAARPFVTELHALHQPMYLRISPECALKRLMVAGFDRVYELGRSFRNEGIDGSHNPEFTMVEWYEAYSDYLGQTRRFEELVAKLALDVNGTTRITFRGRELDLAPPWRRMPMLDGLRDIAGIDLSEVTVAQLPAVFARHHPRGEEALPQPLSWGTAVVALFEALVEPHLWEPVFVMDHPMEVSPLTKQHRSDPRLVERFEPYIAGMEVGNAYSELNDGEEQWRRLVDQQVAREDAYDIDHDFMQAIACGMPQAGGTGMGIDRIVMLLTGVESIRDVVFFPFVGA